MTNDPYLHVVNEEYEFNITPEAAKSLDMIPDGPGRYHLLHEGQAYTIEVLEADFERSTYTLLLNGRKQVVRVADFYDRLVQALGLQAGGSQKINSVKAPMPGLVLEVSVTPGQSVQKGDTLLILEAMKMENVIKAAGEGVVKAVPAAKGLAVDKGQVLIEFE
ncbi:MAG: acetyl-CoA carboxylase biotin carboxyl carrier protein subunit [Saprospiraceae bacterium]